MKKNNKGFTLVELLAALVILGVLSMLALPTVVNLLGNSRDKLYITDAKKLISQAEYKFRVASSEIEKPDDGDCLILSMVYLDNSDFDNPPNNGEYVREASYVVVKNNNGNFEFSVELVEEVEKGVFKGVELSKDSNLSTSSVRHVVSFKKDDLYFVENNTVMGKYSGNQVDTSYINSKLGASYVNSISKVYNYPDLADSTYNANYAIPKITRAEFTSASNKNFNSLDSILKIVATDVDTPTRDLVVLVAPGSMAAYPSMSTVRTDCNVNNPLPRDTACMYQYGELTDFSLKINWNEHGFDYTGQTASLYIVIMDPEGNTDRLKREYKIHSNDPPVIDTTKSGIFKRSSDSINLVDAVLKLYVDDDSTPIEDLEFCLTENVNATTCGNGYRKFSEFVNNELSYTFSCEGVCNYNGETRSLKVFLKDTDPTTALETTQVFNYTLFKNNPPEISNLELISEPLPFVTDSSKALKATVKLSVNDSSTPSNIKVTMSESPSFSDASTVTKTYADFNNDVEYTFSGYYDGQKRTLYVRVTDEYDTYTDMSYDYGNVHRNAQPVINKVEMVSEDLLTKVCPNTKRCDQYEGAGGADELVVTVTATDDIVADENLYVCVSVDENACTNVSTGNFLPYGTGREAFLDFSNMGSIRYDGSEKNVYVSVYDKYAADANGNSTLAEYSGATPSIYKYKIYDNQPPEINESEIVITPKNEDYRFKDVTVSFKTVDDLDNVNQLKYEIYDDAGGDVKRGTISATDYDTANEIEFVFGGDYDGVERTLYIKVTDTYNESTIVEQKYAIHGNEAPNVNYVTVASAEEPCTSDSCDNGNSLKTNVTFSFSDDLDKTQGDFYACISSVENECSNYLKLADHATYNADTGEFTMPYTIVSSDPLPYKGTTENVYVFVRDTDGAIGKKTGTYTLYNNAKAQIDSGYPIVRSSNYEEHTENVYDEDGNITDETVIVNKNPNLSTITFKLKASDEFTTATNLKYKVCYITDITKDITKESDITCLENGKFYDYEPDASGVDTQQLDLGVNKFNGQQFYLFAKVYDEYAYACATGTQCSEDYIGYSSTTYYQVYQDIDPVINKFTVTRPADTTSYSTLDLTFNVSDTLDTYTYCISEEEIPYEEGQVPVCPNYSTTVYDGDSTSDVTITYSPSWGTTFDPSKERNFLLYLYLKDSNGHVVYTSTFPERIPCYNTEGENGEFIDSGTVMAPVEYVLNSGSTEITASRCSNKCYYWEAYELDGVSYPSSGNDDIVAYYKQTMTFLDKDDRSITCSREVNENYEARCNFRTCYYNSANNNYVVTAIGYMENDNTDGSYSHTDGGETHIPEHYHLEYTTDYDVDTDSIVLHPTGNKICGDCFDAGKYSNKIVTYDNNYETEGE